MKFKEKAKRMFFNSVGKVVNGLSQNEGDYEKSNGPVTEGMDKLLQKVACEGTVLLKNDGVLPFSADETISVFGRVQLDWFYVGYGSGGDVNAPYRVNLIDGLKNEGVRINDELAAIYSAWCEDHPADHGVWGKWPRYLEEMPLDEGLVTEAARYSDCAVVVIGRAAGEDLENIAEKGSYFLTDDEKEMLTLVTDIFPKTAVILNIGGVMDVSWIASLKGRIALLIPWQGGMESGDALASILSGKEEPSGRLADTFAKSYADYPSAADFGKKDFNNYTEDIFVGYRFFETFRKEAVIYPFGYGLGYTDFELSFTEANEKNGVITLRASVINTGTRAGKETAELYAEAPQGLLGKPSRVLVSFAKTKELAPGESADVTFTVPIERLASYDDSGKTGHKSCYVMEKGSYGFFLGKNVRDAKKVWEYKLPRIKVLQKLGEVSAPKKAFSRLAAKTAPNGCTVNAYESVPTATTDLRSIILAHLPAAIPQTGDRGIRLEDVKSGQNTLNEFAAQLSNDELEALTRGDYAMNSPLGASGNGGVFGGVLPSLREKGVPPVTATDGPSGIRLRACASLLPIGAVLASTWNEKLIESLYALVGTEMQKLGSDVLLGPGMNIHRNPLCGRNFEYFSEDPLLTGKTAAAVVRGVETVGLSACPKHFACNNQETNRNHTDSRVSERALREIYLKGFEICVKESEPKNIMTSYNKINGVWGHYNYELCTTILRGEWGYSGNIMTDWWMQKSASPEFPKLSDNAYRVRAGVDLLMPGGDRMKKKVPDGTLLKTLGRPDGITLGEIQRCAKDVLTICLEKI